MRAYRNINTTDTFLSVSEQADLIATVQNVPLTLTTTDDGSEVSTYGRTPASDAALSRLLQAFSPLIGKVARTARRIEDDDAEGILTEAFIRAVRSHDLAAPAAFSRDIATMLRYALALEERTGSTVKVADNVSARYRRLVAAHDGDVAAAYAECRDTANGFAAHTFLLTHAALNSVSLDEMLSGPEPRTDAALVASAESFDEQLAQADLVRWLFAQVEEKPAQVLRLRYGFTDPVSVNLRLRAGFLGDPDRAVMSDAEVARCMSSTTPTTNRIRARALDTMREALSSLVDA